jgi:hypothetical protein
MATETTNISTLSSGTRDTSRMKYGDETSFSVSSDTNLEVFNVDTQSYKGAISVQANNTGANGMTVSVLCSGS